MTTATARPRRALRPGQLPPRATRHVAESVAGGQRWRWKIPRAALISALRAGHSLSRIARSYEVNRSTVGRAVRCLSISELSSVAIGKAQPESAIPEIATPDLQSPIDVMGEITGVMDDIRHLRAWLVSEAGRATLRTPQRIAFLIGLLDKRLNAVGSLVQNRERLMKIIGTDMWIREMFAVLDEEDHCPSCHTAMHLKDRVMERIRQKLVGETPLVSVPAPRDAARDEADAGEP